MLPVCVLFKEPVDKQSNPLTFQCDCLGKWCLVLCLSEGEVIYRAVVLFVQ